MKAITIHQPWAQWIAWGLKTIETRRHDRFRNFRGELAIHAGAIVDDYAYSAAAGAGTHLPAGWIGLTEDALKTWKRTPRVVAVARVIEARRLKEADSEAALCPAAGLYGLVLADIRTLKTPVQCRGQQGIWTLPPEVEAEVRRQIA